MKRQHKLNLSAEELRQQLIETLGVFDLYPVTALTIDMQLRVG